MSAEKMDSTPIARTQSAVQLNLLSLVLLTALSGFCGGLTWAVITSILDFLGFIELDKFSSYIVNLVTFPLIGMFFSAFFSMIGYPIYKWRCRQIRGQKLSGLFIN
jgi:hypothetical protein